MNAWLKTEVILVLLLIAVVSGGYSIYSLVTQGAVTAPPAGAASAQPNQQRGGTSPAPGVQQSNWAPAAGGGAAALAGAGAAAGLSGPGVQKHLVAKTPGHWVVDATGGAGSDSNNLADVLYNAKDGDVITLKPGTYAEASVIAHSLTLQGEPGELGKPPTAILEAKGGSTLAIAAANVTVDRLLIRQLANPGNTNWYRGIEIRSGDLHLRNSEVVGPGDSTNGQLVTVGHGKLVAEASVFASGLSGIEVDSRGVLELTDCVVRQNARNGLSVKGLGGTVKMTKSRVLENDGEGIWITDGPTVALDDVEVRKNRDGIMLEGVQAQLEIKGSHINMNIGHGLSTRGRALASAIQTTFSDNGKNGVWVSEDSSFRGERLELVKNGRTGMGVEGRAHAELSDSVVKDQSASGIAVGDQTVSKLVKLTVSGNIQGIYAAGTPELSVTGSTLDRNVKGPYVVAPSSTVKLTAEGNSPKLN